MPELKIVPPLPPHPDGPSWSPPTARGLDRGQIVRAATRYIDVHGLSRLTMGRLGAELGVEAMALHQYVPGREALLDEVAAELLQGLVDDDRMLPHPPVWQAYLQELAHAVRDLALEHPQVFPVIAARPADAPWLRPPVRSLPFVESLFTGLQAYGFADADVVSTYRVFSTFLLGHLLFEVAGQAVAPQGHVSPVRAHGPDVLARYPRVARCADGLAADHARQEFEEALESLLDRIQVSLAS